MEPKRNKSATLPTFVFKRPKNLAKLKAAEPRIAESEDPSKKIDRLTAELVLGDLDMRLRSQVSAKTAEIQALETQIQALQAKLAKAKNLPETTLLIDLELEYPLDAKALAEMVQKLAERKLGPKAHFKIRVHTPGRGSVELSGDSGYVAWAKELCETIGKLAEK